MAESEALRVLITGGAGYVGSSCAAVYAANGADVTVLDNLSTGSEGALTGIENCRFVRGDITDMQELARIFREGRFDAVVNFAGIQEMAGAQMQPDAVAAVNVMGIRNILMCMAQFGVPFFVLSSNAEAFGEPQYIPVDEKHRTVPTNVYQDTLIAGENMMRMFEKEYEFNYVVLRYYNVAGTDGSGFRGPAQAGSRAAHAAGNEGSGNLGSGAGVLRADDQLGRILAAAASVGSGNVPLVYSTGNGTQDGTIQRDYLHIDDITDAHLKAIEYLLDGGKSDKINLGNDRPFSMAEMLQKAGEITGVSIPAETVPASPGDIPVKWASNKKAASVLGWRPLHSDLDTIIRSAWQWISIGS